MKILAIDYGMKNFGLAISEGYLAEPFGVLKAEKPLDVLSKLRKIVYKHEIDLIIIGLPEGKLKGLVKQFSTKLKSVADKPIVLVDETLTTQDAKKKMEEAHISRKKRSKNKHAFAACLILQSYLEQYSDLLEDKL
jgi:putative holliday junction resolvase